MDKDEKTPDLDLLFDGLLRPLHSKNARRIFDVFYDNKHHLHLTTYDLENILNGRGFSISKKEINAWLVSLQEAGLIHKLETRGKPVAPEYNDRYTFDLWQLSEAGLNLRQRLRYLVDVKEVSTLPKLAELSLDKLNDIEDLYFTSKILLLLHSNGGSLSFTELRKRLALDREKLAVYSWPDASHSENPLFEIKVKSPTLRTRAFKLLGWVIEDDLTFTLTKAGSAMVEIILENTGKSET
jgi:DNA-binding HxlR family transcriptional regulator